MRHTKFISVIAVAAAITAISVFGYRTFSKKEIKEEKKENILFSSSDKRVQAAQAKIKKFPESASGYNQLAAAYMQVARETGDFSLNAKSDEALKHALEIDANNYDSLKLKTKLLLTFHRFQEALELAKKLEATHRQDHDIYGALTDANVELGNYEEAVTAAQKMVDLRPDTSSYSRVAHLRSLHGDTKGAIEAMRVATRIADPKDKEAQAWCYVHLGNELLKTGKYDEAEKEYDNALEVFPDYYLALAAKGRARASVGDYEKAIEFYKRAQEKVPQTETVIALGDIYTKLGKTDEAKKQYDLAEFIEQKLGDASDQRRLALLYADRDVKLDEALAIAQREKQKRKDIFTADVLAWCLYKKGFYKEAKAAIDEAIRLKTKDAGIFYHAGMISKALGNAKEAEHYLQLAIQTHPAFDILQSEKAKESFSLL
jgi:tetratricopeptide (TPR) repeat protein